MFTSECTAGRTKSPSPELLDAHRQLIRVANSKLEDQAPDDLGRRHAYLRFQEIGIDRLYSITLVLGHQEKPGAGGLFIDGMTLRSGIPDEMLVSIHVPQNDVAVIPDNIYLTSGLTASGIQRLASELENAEPISEGQYRSASRLLVTQAEVRFHS